MFANRSWIRTGLIGIILSITLVVAMVPHSQASASFSVCRGDPIIILSDGTNMTITTTIYADMSAVDRVTYTVHVPKGVRATKILYPDGMMAFKEIVVVVADNKPHKHSSAVKVSARDKTIPFDVTGFINNMAPRTTHSTVAKAVLLVY